MYEREFQRIVALRSDQALLREAAAVIRAAPANQPSWAVLSDPWCAELLASIVDMAAERVEHMPGPDRTHWVRVASELCGRRMDRPSVRRTRRRY